MNFYVHSYDLNNQFTTRDPKEDGSDDGRTYFMTFNEPPRKGEWVFIPLSFFDITPNTKGFVDLTQKHLEPSSSNDVDDYKAAEVLEIAYTHTSPGYLPSCHVFTDGFR
jgi:hypothetical protein